MPPRGGEGMTDTHAGAVPSRTASTLTRHTSQSEPTPEVTSKGHDEHPLGGNAAGHPYCRLAGRRPQGPTAATRSSSARALTPTPIESCQQRSGPAKNNLQTLLTRPRSYRDDLRTTSNAFQRQGSLFVRLRPQCGPNGPQLPHDPRERELNLGRRTGRPATNARGSRGTTGSVTPATAFESTSSRI